jgi:hypothetical protein
MVVDRSFLYQANASSIHHRFIGLCNPELLTTRSKVAASFVSNEASPYTRAR